MVKERVIAAMKAGGAMSTPQIAAALRGSEERVRLAVRELHAGLYIHIESWARNKTRGNPYAIWAWGYGQDAPKPERARDREVEIERGAETESYKTIARLRAAGDAAGPFRVLMAQVAA